MLNFNLAKNAIQRDTLLYFAAFVLIGTVAISGVLYGYYHCRAKNLVAEAVRTEQAFLGLFKSVLTKHDVEKEPQRIASLLSRSGGVLQGEILILGSDSSLAYPPVGLTDFSLPASGNAAFSAAFPEAWKEISSHNTKQFHDKEGVYIFTAFSPLAGQSKSSSNNNPTEPAEHASTTAPEQYKLVSFISNDSFGIPLSRLRLELAALAAVIIALALAPFWIAAAMIVKRKHYEKKLWCVATYDTLTGVYNRAMFSEKLEYLFIQSERYSHQFALLIINLDRFRSINDRLGHQAGDLLLQETATRLIETLRKSDIVARLGDDEFAIILPEISRMEIAEAVAKRIMYTLGSPFSLEGDEKVVSASIGVALFPEDGNDAEAILKHAERALYYAKEQGGNNYILFRSLWRMTSD